MYLAQDLTILEMKSGTNRDHSTWSVVRTFACTTLLERSVLAMVNVVYKKGKIVRYWSKGGNIATIVSEVSC